MLALEMVSNYTYAIGLENAAPSIPPSKIEVPTTFIEAMNSEHSKELKKTMELELECIRGSKVAVLTPISDVPRDKRVLGTKWV